MKTTNEPKLDREQRQGRNRLLAGREVKPHLMSPSPEINQQPAQMRLTMKPMSTTKQILTRSDYLAHKCTHDEYYAQFVAPWTKELVARGIGIDRIKASKDPHFNDIPLADWDDVQSGGVPTAIAFRDAGDTRTISGNTCVMKRAAKMLKEENA